MWLARAVLTGAEMRWILVALILLCGSSAAHAERRRVVVLAFDGPRADQVRNELVKLVKKSHTVVALESWQRTARNLSVTKVTTASTRKVARKLNVDAVIEGSTTNRGGGVRVRIRLRSGASGETVEELLVATKGTSFDKATQRDIRDELIDVISSLDEDEARRKRKAR